MYILTFSKLLRRSLLDMCSTKIVPIASHITLIVVRNRSLGRKTKNDKLVDRMLKIQKNNLQKPINGNDNGNIFCW